jgi:flagellar basal-body rod protein FlgB
MEIQTTSLLLKALDGLWLRSAVTAHNIANANTPNYRPLKVSFEAALKVAAGRDAAALEAVSPKIDIAIDDEGRSELRTDLEMATATSTAGRYGTIAELLNRQLQIQALALSGSR